MIVEFQISVITDCIVYCTVNEMMKITLNDVE